MDPIVKTVGGNLRRLRVEGALTLSELASQSGVAKATLVNLEAGRGNPTIETLWALALALEVPFSDLLEAPDELPLRIVRARDGSHVTGSSSNESSVDLRLLDRIQGPALLEVYDLRIADGARASSRPHATGTVERAVATEGTIELGPEGESATLEPGDSIRYPADRPHVYAAVGGPARAVLLVEYRSRSRTS